MQLEDCQVSHNNTFFVFEMSNYAPRNHKMGTQSSSLVKDSALESHRMLAEAYSERVLGGTE